VNSSCTYNRRSSTDDIEQTVDSLDRGEKAFVTFGTEGCGGVLDKSGRLIEIGDYQRHYPTFNQDMAEQLKDPTPWKRKIVGSDSSHCRGKQLASSSNDKACCGSKPFQKR